MFWIDSHRRLRERLSDYIDGELDAAATGRLEAHLTECARCREELEQLRATVTALRDLPEAEAPRSFALAAEQVAGPRRAGPAPAPLAIGARIAAAGVAAALAAVLVVDLGGFGNGGGADEAGAPSMYGRTQSEERGLETFRGQGAPVPEPAGTPAGAFDAGGGDAAGGPDTGDAAGGPLPSEPEADGPAADVGAPEAAESPTAGEGADSTLKMGEASETPAAAPEEGEPETGVSDDADRAAAASEGGGIDALTVAEISLAAALGVLLAGSLVLAIAGRKR